MWGTNYQSLLSLICGLHSITTPRKSNLAIKMGVCLYHQNRALTLGKLTMGVICVVLVHRHACDH